MDDVASMVFPQVNRRSGDQEIRANESVDIYASTSCPLEPWCVSRSGPLDVP